MNILILTRGAPGCGKSTWINRWGFDEYTLSPDNIRLMFQSPEVDINGGEHISQKNDGKVWATLFQILEERMRHGEFTIIDATHSTTQMINRYRDLTTKYRYRVYILDFTDVSLEECLLRNKERGYKFVPEEVIKNIYSRFEYIKPGGYTTVLSPNPEDDNYIFKVLFEQSTRLPYPQDFSEFESIYHFGDIHGCADTLEEFFEKYPYSEKSLYIFVGDYLDRGLRNADTFKFLAEFIKNKNAIMLHGNHELKMRRFINDNKCPGNFYATWRELSMAGITLNDIKHFYYKLSQVCYYIYNGVKVFCNHGGVPVFNITTPCYDIYNGTGKYEDIDTVHKTWNEEMGGTYQIHGHRNPLDSPMYDGGYNYNLDEAVEHGGNLRVLKLSKEGFEEIYIKNNNFIDHSQDVSTDFIERLRADKHINEKQYGEISSFNFDREAFQDKIWNEETTKARGLFINTHTGEIVARSYDKFFNMDERIETKDHVIKKRNQFPMIAYRKYNGFLGILSWYNGPLFCTKSTVGGDYAQDFERIARKNPNIEKFCEWLHENNFSAVFEVISKNDPHIVEYEKEEVFLLDIIYNEENFRKLSYEDLVNISNKFSFYWKQIMDIIHTEEDFDTVIEQIQQQKDCEGVVIETADGFMFKLKTKWYKFWKYMRSIKDTLAAGKPVKQSWLQTAEQNETFNKMSKLMEEVGKETFEQMSIIQVRNKLEE